MLYGFGLCSSATTFAIVLNKKSVVVCYTKVWSLVFCFPIIVHVLFSCYILQEIMQYNLYKYLHLYH